MNSVNILEEIYSAQKIKDQVLKIGAKKDSDSKYTGEFRKLLKELKEYLADFHSNLLSKSILDEFVQQQVIKIIKEYLAENISHVSGFTLDELTQSLITEICGFGPLDNLLSDHTISEIMVNNYQEVYVEKSGKIVPTEVCFQSDEQLIHIIRKILAPIGRSLDLSEPYVDARLPGGSRVNAIISPLALNGTTLTIRKFAKVDYTAQELIELGTCDDKMVELIRVLVEGRVNLLIIGGTGSGKTSTMKFCANFIPKEERIITIEDVEELRLSKNRSRHVISLEARKSKENPISLYDLLVNCLRMRPDRILIGEVRGKEALEMIEAMNTGHEGSMCTLHANGPKEAIKRLALMIMRSGLDIDPFLVQELICDTIDVIVTQRRLPEDGSRKIVSITEVTGFSQGRALVQDILRFEKQLVDGKVHGDFKLVNPLSSKLQAKLSEHGIKAEEISCFV